jgi:hypothetical protein
VLVAGEFNNSYNDCGLYLINGTQHYSEPLGLLLRPTLTTYCRWRLLAVAGREHMAHGPTLLKLARSSFALASMDTTRDWFFSMRKVRLFART